jgi:hypothetical protein
MTNPGPLLVRGVTKTRNGAGGTLTLPLPPRVLCRPTPWWYIWHSR